MTRWIAIDYGAKRIGVASGSTTNGIATPLKVLPARPLDDAIANIAHLVDEYTAEGIVVGWPLNMDDTEGPQGREAREMALKLSEHTHLDVRMWDERLSSFEADKVLAGKLTRAKKRRIQDAIAATVILQDFFSRAGPDSAPNVQDMQDQ